MEVWEHTIAGLRGVVKAKALPTLSGAGLEITCIGEVGINVLVGIVEEKEERKGTSRLQ